MTLKRRSYNPTVQKKAFTLIELLIGLAIGSLILALIYNFLSTSINLSTRTLTNLNRVDDTEYSLDYIRSEINASRYFIDRGGRLTIYIYDKNQSPHHLYCQYYIEDKNLYRAALHEVQELVDFKGRKITSGKNLILENVDELNYRFDRDLLLLEMEVDGKIYHLNHFIRGRKL